MKCYQCKFENIDPAKFCTQCGTRLSVVCPSCEMMNSAFNRFCRECGTHLSHLKTSHYKRIAAHPIEYISQHAIPFNEENKFLTILFSDLSHYTSLSERFDPEFIKEIVDQLTGESRQIIEKYNGLVTRIIGDRVMALFGMQKSNEDDAVSAIKSGREIHQMTALLSPKYESKLGEPLFMHTGINTGEAIVERCSIEEGMYNAYGDTVNVTSRLCDIAGEGEILVGFNTYKQALGHYEFEKIPETQIKGKSERFQIYRVTSPVNKALTIHCNKGLQANLIGRDKELRTLGAFEKMLLNDKKVVVNIIGEAGTGKSRLIQEFKARVNLKKIHWVQSYAYAHTQKRTYFPFIDLINRLLMIEEEDSIEILREKLENGIKDIADTPEKIIPVIGMLYGFHSSKLKGMGPDGWQDNLKKALNTLLVSLSAKGPVVYCFEDVHWADSPSINMLKDIICNFRFPSFFLCTYRPSLSFFQKSQIASMKERSYKEIMIRELKATQVQKMIVSLLDSKKIPDKLSRFIKDRSEGNPFYLEELVNWLVESGVLKKEAGDWKLSNSFIDLKIPPTIHGVIAARIDRLEHKSKRILQEASVFGRAFLFDILKKISSIGDDVESHFDDLKRIDLIRRRSLYPDLEFVFKHTLTQEVGYKSLLNKEKRQIHESIAHVMEDLFHERLSEFYESLANHYKKGYSIEKAIHYLNKSGQKSLQHYALEESHNYFLDAYNLINEQRDELKDADLQLLNILNQWAFVFYYRGDSNGLFKLLIQHEHMAREIAGSSEKAMFFAWLGRTLWAQESFKEAYIHLTEAFHISEQLNAHTVQCYTRTWLTWVCAELGLLKEGIEHGEKAQILHKQHCPDEHFLYFDSNGGLGFVYWLKGEIKKVFEIGKELIEFGRQHANLRSMVFGHCCQGWSYHADLDFEKAIHSLEQAVQISEDPWYTQFSRLSLCFIFFYMGKDDQAKKQISKIYESADTNGATFIIRPISFLNKLYTILEKKEYHNICRLESEVNVFKERGSILRYALLRLSLTKFYQSIQQKNVKTGNNTHQLIVLSQEGLIDLISLTQEYGVTTMQRHCHLYLGKLYINTGEREKALEHLNIARNGIDKENSPYLFSQVEKLLSSM